MRTALHVSMFIVRRFSVQSTSRGIGPHLNAPLSRTPGGAVRTRSLRVEGVLA